MHGRTAFERDGHAATLHPLSGGRDGWPLSRSKNKSWRMDRDDRANHETVSSERGNGAPRTGGRYTVVVLARQTRFECRPMSDVTQILSAIEQGDARRR